MLHNRTIAVIVPAYNEEQQIRLVLDTMPAFVDRVIIVNDCSTDNTREVISSYFEKSGRMAIPGPVVPDGPTLYNQAEIHLARKSDEEWEKLPPHEIIHPDPEGRLVLINLKKNGGVGLAIAVGYKWAQSMQIDCTAVMAGDGQMDPAELESICTPVIAESIDYVKGNRLIHRSAFDIIPRKRFLGNSILSILTKIASGYWKVSDTQTGYTAISLRALKALNIPSIYPRYGMPNDMLVKLNILTCTLREVEIKPVYNIGEKSKLKMNKVIAPIILLLVKSFFRRLYHKYLFRDFHPLFVLYHLGFVLLLASIPYAIKLINLMLSGEPANPLTALAFLFLSISGFQAMLFAMWMDIQDNQDLYSRR
jgi:glycosyltransferase involved in cell wall biosynthesis